MEKAQVTEEHDPRMIVKGEQAVPTDWDSFEVTRDFAEPVLQSEVYENIIDQMKNVENCKTKILYKIAYAIMQDYYAKALGMQAVGELFYECYHQCIKKNQHIARSKERKQRILAMLYEYFSRANARRSVAENEREGRNLVESCGLSWAGTTYYNSQFFYTCQKMQRLFRNTCRKIIKEEQLSKISFETIECQTEFLHVGGIAFHSVFVWVQKKNNHPGNQYGMRELERMPPKHFVYLYRNHFAKSESAGVQLLEKKMKQNVEIKNGLWRGFTVEDGRDYHNGMSYLLEGCIRNEQNDSIYEDAMGFLQNFILYRLSGCIEFLSVGEKLTL